MRGGGEGWLVASGPLSAFLAPDPRPPSTPWGLTQRSFEV